MIVMEFWPSRDSFSIEPFTKSTSWMVVSVKLPFSCPGPGLCLPSGDRKVTWCKTVDRVHRNWEWRCAHGQIWSLRLFVGCQKEGSLPVSICLFVLSVHHCCEAFGQVLLHLSRSWYCSLVARGVCFADDDTEMHMHLLRYGKVLYHQVRPSRWIVNSHQETQPLSTKSYTLLSQG